MTELRLHSRVVHTVFDLLGDKEDDITYSFGWALAQSDALVAAVLSEFFEGEPGEPEVVRLQDFSPGAGRTDVELQTDAVHLILEAKRGWDLPRPGQLEQYATRFEADNALEGAIAVVAEGSAEWASPQVPNVIDGIPVHYLPWSRVVAIVEKTATETRSSTQKRLLREFLRYLKGLMTMQNITSNEVFVVALGLDPLVDDGMTFADIVTEERRYFHPLSGTWPKTPPNYLGFRFDGQVQQICHVEAYELHDAPWEEMPRLKGQLDWPPSPHLFYRLGPPIVPPQTVKTDGLYGPGHHWAALDLLLTSNSLRVARDLTQERLSAAGEG